MKLLGQGFNSFHSLEASCTAHGLGCTKLGVRLGKIVQKFGAKWCTLYCYPCPKPQNPMGHIVPHLSSRRTWIGLSLEAHFCAGFSPNLPLQACPFPPTCPQTYLKLTRSLPAIGKPTLEPFRGDDGGCRAGSDFKHFPSLLPWSHTRKADSVCLTLAEKCTRIPRRGGVVFKKGGGSWCLKIWAPLQ